MTTKFIDEEKINASVLRGEKQKKSKEKPKTEKKGKYVVKDGEGNIISQNMPKEFEDMIDLIFQEAKEKSKKARKNGL